MKPLLVSYPSTHFSASLHSRTLAKRTVCLLSSLPQLPFTFELAFTWLLSPWFYGHSARCPQLPFLVAKFIGHYFLLDLEKKKKNNNFDFLAFLLSYSPGCPAFLTVPGQLLTSSLLSNVNCSRPILSYPPPTALNVICLLMTSKFIT